MCLCRTVEACFRHSLTLKLFNSQNTQFHFSNSFILIPHNFSHSGTNGLPPHWAPPCVRMSAQTQERVSLLWLGETFFRPGHCPRQECDGKNVKVMPALFAEISMATLLTFKHCYNAPPTPSTEPPHSTTRVSNQSAHSEIRLMAPQSYAGEATCCNTFIMQCSLQFEIQPSQFPSQCAKIA